MKEKMKEKRKSTVLSTSDKLHNEEKNRLVRVINNSKLIIRISGALLAIFYGFLKLKGIDVVIDPVIKEASTEILIKTSLFVYFFSWLYGITMDASDHGEVFQKIINNKRTLTLFSILSGNNYFIFCSMFFM
jgi:hypothetical protein